MKTLMIKDLPRIGQAFHFGCCFTPYRPLKSVGKDQSPRRFHVLRIRSQGRGEKQKILEYSKAYE